MVMYLNQKLKWNAQLCNYTNAVTLVITEEQKVNLLMRFVSDSIEYNFEKNRGTLPKRKLSLRTMMSWSELRGIQRQKHFFCERFLQLSTSLFRLKCWNNRRTSPVLRHLGLLKDRLLFLAFWYLLNLLEVGTSCHGGLPSQSFVSADSEIYMPPAEDHFGSRAHSFPGLRRLRSGTSPKRFRSGPEVKGSEESRQDWIARLKCSFLSHWNPETTSLLLYPQFPRKLEWYSLPVIWEYSSLVPS